jgi:hypothetical protein
MGQPEEKEKDGTVPPQETQTVTRRSYHKPSFRFERVFETRALACGKLGTQPQCQSNPKTS